MSQKPHLSVSIVLSFSRSAAADRLASCFPQVIVSQHARLCSAHSETVQGSSPLRPDCSHYLYSSTDRKTIDERTLNLIPFPPGSKGTLELLEHTSMSHCVCSLIFTLGSQRLRLRILHWGQSVHKSVAIFTCTKIFNQIENLRDGNFWIHCLYGH